jgi:hypothetical protein
MTNKEEKKALEEKLDKIGKKMGIEFKVFMKPYSYSIVFNADQNQPQEKVLISYIPKSHGRFEDDDFYTTFAFERETTLMMSNPRELLEIADEIIKEIKE